MSEQAALQPSDPARRSVALAGGTAAYTDEGPADAPALLCIHGLPGSGRDFRWLAPAIGDRLRVIRLDLPGFGEAPADKEVDVSPEGRATYALALADALGLDRPVLLGHSMGGVVACAAVRRAPTRFAALALLATPGLRPHAMFRRTPFAAIQRAQRLPMVTPLLRRALPPLFRRVGFPRTSSTHALLTMAGGAAVSFPRHAENVRALRLPTLVAYCTDDPLIETAISDELAAACPEGARLRFDHGGHNLQKTQAHAVADAVVALAAAVAIEPHGPR